MQFLFSRFLALGPFLVFFIFSNPLQAQVSGERETMEMPPMARLLQQAGLKAGQVGVAIWPLASDKPSFMHHAQDALNPASAMKILTTYAALSLLGPEYRWKTHFYLSKPLQGDVLPGDLIIRGGGDPKLVIEDLQALVQQLRAKGLREIQGDLIIDGSLFDVGDQSVELSFDGDPTQPYNVRPHAALMNFKATNFIVTPTEGGLQLRTDPELADVDYDFRVKPVAGPCRYGAAGLSIRDDGNANKARVVVSGQYSVSCGEQGAYTSVLTHRQFMHGFFKAAWLAAGGSFAGQTRFAKQSRKDLKPWFVWESPRNLTDVVRDINKFSNNVMARQLLLQLSADILKLPGTVDRARNAVTTWLQGKQFNFPELVIENGSGLSRIERISALHLAALLREAAATPLASHMREALPVVGVDGTMRSRLRSDPIAGNAWMKTGSLTGVRSIAGYVRAASGKEYVLVVLVNGPRAEGSQDLQDQLLRWVHQKG